MRVEGGGGGDGLGRLSVLSAAGGGSPGLAGGRASGGGGDRFSLYGAGDEQQRSSQFGRRGSAHALMEGEDVDDGDAFRNSVLLTRSSTRRKGSSGGDGKGDASDAKRRGTDDNADEGAVAAGAHCGAQGKKKKGKSKWDRLKRKSKEDKEAPLLRPTLRGFLAKKQQMLRKRLMRKSLKPQDATPEDVAAVEKQLSNREERRASKRRSRMERQSAAGRHSGGGDSLRRREDAEEGSSTSESSASSAGGSSKGSGSSRSEVSAESSSTSSSSGASPTESSSSSAGAAARRAHSRGRDSSSSDDELALARKRSTYLGVLRAPTDSSSFSGSKRLTQAEMRKRRSSVFGFSVNFQKAAEDLLNRSADFYDGTQANEGATGGERSGEGSPPTKSRSRKLSFAFLGTPEASADGPQRVSGLFPQRVAIRWVVPMLMPIRGMQVE